MTVYVILCERGFRYVGKVMPSQDAAASVQRRFVEHCTRRGAVWTSLHRPVQLVQRLLPDVATERDETLAQMRMWGIERVRGAGWCQLHLSPEHVAEIHRGWVENFDLCRRCGSPNHMMDRCDSTVHHLTLEALRPAPAPAAPAPAAPAPAAPAPAEETLSTSHLDRTAQKRLEEIRKLVPLRLYREILATSSSEHIQNSSAFVMECYNEVHRSAHLLQDGLDVYDQMEAPLDTLGKIQLRLLEHRGADMLPILHKLSSAAVRNPSAYLKGLAKKQKMIGSGGRQRRSRRRKPSPDSI